MSVLILQIIIKQWDKSQRTPAHVLQRANIPDRYPIKFPPAVYALDKHCVIDQQGDDIQGSRVNHAKLGDGAVIFDRFTINLASQSLAYYDNNANKTPRIIGCIANQWLQCKYNYRYSIFQSELYYWLYEEVTLNAAWLNQFDESVFLKSAPTLVYQDMNDLNNSKKP
ncbi:hypothetical protein [Crenothrix sp.]|uniref:hypothetical protein n=1 Tax=Crenothrix sp. TaxID=3100433 RepID=UPI00374DB824